ncbi:MAG: hypothetical protein QXP52_02190 [Candidatus Aenigmatarchaeota archaeon]
MEIRAISAYIATIILVVVTIGMGVAIYLYLSGYLGGLTGGTEIEQEKLFECIGARLDVDYYKNNTELNVIFTNIGSVDLGKNFLIKAEFTEGSVIHENTTLEQSLSPGETAQVKIDISGISSAVKRVTVLPLDKC